MNENNKEKRGRESFHLLRQKSKRMILFRIAWGESDFKK